MVQLTTPSYMPLLSIFLLCLVKLLGAIPFVSRNEYESTFVLDTFCDMVRLKKGHLLTAVSLILEVRIGYVKDSTDQPGLVPHFQIKLMKF